MEIKSYDKIFSDMLNYMIAHQDKITDFNDGSAIASQLEAFAREIGELYVRTRVGFSTHLRGLPYSVFDFRMIDGRKASTRIVFSRSRPFSYQTDIPAGAIVSSGSLIFLTTEPAVVKSGETESQPVSVTAQDIGEQYNVQKNKIKTIQSTLSADIVKVDNPEDATGGTNSEDWQAYLARFADYILGLQRTNFYGFLTGLTIDNLVRSLEIEEHFPPLDDIWNMTVYMEDGSGGMTQEALDKAKATIDGNRIQTNGGYRAPGINVRYLTPEIIPVKLHVSVKADHDVVNEVDESVVIDEVRETIKKFVNSLKIGEEVKKADIILVLKRIPYLSDADCFNANIPISKRQIARYEDLTVGLVIE